MPAAQTLRPFRAVKRRGAQAYTAGAPHYLTGRMLDLDSAQVPTVRNRAPAKGAGSVAPAPSVRRCRAGFHLPAPCLPSLSSAAGRANERWNRRRFYATHGVNRKLGFFCNLTGDSFGPANRDRIVGHFVRQLPLSAQQLSIAPDMRVPLILGYSGTVTPTRPARRVNCAPASSNAASILTLTSSVTVAPASKRASVA